tara:strand:- start:70 stop:312 length:243 start_codon:yes stop_codon:yes gene_type:complete
MSKEEIRELAEQISFRLVATKKHTDFDWLLEILTNAINKQDLGEYKIEIDHEKGKELYIGVSDELGLIESIHITNANDKE